MADLPIDNDELVTGWSDDNWPTAYSSFCKSRSIIPKLPRAR